MAYCEKELEEMNKGVKNYLKIKEKYDLLDVNQHSKTPEVHLMPRRFLELFKNEDNIVDCMGTKIFRFKYFKVVDGVKYYCLSENKINFRD